MKYLNAIFHTEAIDKGFIVDPTKSKLLGERNQRNDLTTQTQVLIDTEIERNQKFVKNKNNELEVKP